MAGTPYDALIEREQKLFGLDGEWAIESQFAEGGMREFMEREDWVACSEFGAGDLVTFFFHEEAMKDPDISPEAVIDHELAHIIINPFPAIGFCTGVEMEETKATHINKACQMLRETSEDVRVNPDDNLETILERAKRLTRLDENNWQIRVVKKEYIERNGDRLPAFAYSLFYQNHAHLALLGARQIILEIDRTYIEQNRLSLADVILKELWRVIMNPYGPPDITNVQERQLKHIMMAMKGLGWAKNR